ncbi:MAG: hypothetical protein L3K01_01730 [Thermoplasmata archaeon]|nr:hypothetical protein [Thermoplasmata archaeon]
MTELAAPDRAVAPPILNESFTGYYRGHAKRTLGETGTVRAAQREGALAGVALLEQLESEVGCVSCIFVGNAHRR